MAEPAIMDEIQKALQLEALARRGRDGGERIRLLGGKRVDANGGTWSYSFMTERKRVWFRQDEAVHLVAGRSELLAVVAAWERGRRVTLSVRRDLGLRIDQAVVIRDDSFLIEALARRFDLARGGHVPCNWSLINQLLDPAQWVRPAGAVHSNGNGHLNREQRAATDAMGSPGVAVIWGPPGTGKTATLATGLHQAWRRGQTVFALANTNVAVDGLLERTLDRLDPDVRDGEVVRVGEIHSGSLKERYGEKVAWGSIIARRRQPLEQRQLELGEQITEVRRALLERAQLSGDELAADLRARLNQLSDEAAEVEREYERVPAKILEEARIIATTVHRSYLPGYLRDQADMVVVDEASMLPLPMAMHAAGLAKKTVVFAGDPMQLGTIVKSKDERVRRLVGRCVFRPPTSTSNKLVRAAPILLRRQYRMDPEIADLVNHLSYGPGTLVTPAAVRIRKRPATALLSSPLSYIDTTDLQARAEIPAGTCTRVNECHAQIVAGLLAGLENVSTAVITPYWGQARAIRKGIPSRLRKHVTVDTVHRFQGSERDVVILDLPDSQPASLGKFMVTTNAEESGSRLITVGISRPRFHLVVVANVGYLTAVGVQDTYVKRLLAYLAENATALSPVQASPHRNGRRR